MVMEAEVLEKIKIVLWKFVITCFLPRLTQIGCIYIRILCLVLSMEPETMEYLFFRYSWIRLVWFDSEIQIIFKEPSQTWTSGYNTNLNML